MKPQPLHNHQPIWFFLLFISLLAVTNDMRAQPCFPQGISLNTQDDIDNFAFNYPNCTDIEGDLIIHDPVSIDIKNLHGLWPVKTVGGALKIVLNHKLSNLEGLENLESIGGELFLLNNYDLTTLKHLESLQSIGGFHLERNFDLDSLGGMNQLNNIDGNIFIKNITFKNLQPFPWPKIVKGDLHLQDCSKLEDLNGMDSITQVNGDLYILGNDSLENIDDLHQLQLVNGELQLSNNSKLTNLGGLSRLKEVDALSILDNDGITDFRGLAQLQVISKDLSIFWNSNLQSLEGLNALEFIGGSLIIDRNSQLKSLNGLPSYRSSVGLETIEIIRNDKLESLSGLDQLDMRFISLLRIENNDKLSHCHIESVCDYLSTCGKIQLSENKYPCNTAVNIEDACRKETDPDFKLNCAIDIFPIPADDYLHVRIRGNVVPGTTYEVIDQTGNSVHMGKLGELAIDISNLVAGIYYIRIASWKYTVTKRFIKL